MRKIRRAIQRIYDPSSRCMGIFHLALFGKNAVFRIALSNLPLHKILNLAIDIGHQIGGGPFFEMNGLHPSEMSLQFVAGLNKELFQESFDPWHAKNITHLPRKKNRKNSRDLSRRKQ